jgi:Septum formation/DnaJ domain
MEPIPDFDLYAELEVNAAASSESIEAVWRSLMKRNHPDTGGASAAVRARRLNVAHDWLADPERRRAYDAFRSSRARATPNPPRPAPNPPRPAPNPPRPAPNPPPSGQPAGRLSGPRRLILVVAATLIVGTVWTVLQARTTSDAFSPTAAPSSFAISATALPTSGPATAVPLVAAADLAVGDCIRDSRGGGSMLVVFGRVQCDEPHDHEVILVSQVTNNSYPTRDQWESLAAAKCGPAFQSYVGPTPGPNGGRFTSGGAVYGDLTVGTVIPGPTYWDNGDRTFTCSLTQTNGIPASRSFRASPAP